MHRDQPVGVVEKVHHANLRVGVATQRLQPARGQRPDVERLQLPHEFRVGPPLRVAPREVRVCVGQLGQRRLALSESRAQTGVFLQEECVHLHQALRYRPELVLTRRQYRKRLQPPGGGHGLLELRRGACDISCDPGSAPQRDDDGQQDDVPSGALRRRGRLERGLCAGFRLISACVRRSEKMPRISGRCALCPRR